MGRLGGSMVAIALVLFTLARYHSAALAGVVTFATVAPGLVLSPLAGALLDRHGRARLIVLDFLVVAFSLFLTGLLGWADRLPALLLVLLTVIGSVTNPLSSTGLRSLFPVLVPEHLWERVNALDSNTLVVATLLGPPAAAGLVAVWGGPTALIAIGAVFAVGAVVLLRTPDPRAETATSGHILLDAWQGVGYTLRNRTLRGLGISLSLYNVGSGVLSIALPLIVLDRLHASPLLVGAVYTVNGLGGIVAALVFGGRDSRGREKSMIVWPLFGSALGLLLLTPTVVEALGPAMLFVGMGILGVLSGPLDIAMFTLRQRRTDPAWMGRAFSVSMSLGNVGYPIGALVAGWLGPGPLDAAVAVGVVCTFLGAVVAAAQIPPSDSRPVAAA